MSSFTINRVVLVGRLTRDPELRSLPSGSSVCGLRIACNSTRRDAEGEYHDKPNYFDVSVFGTSAEQRQPLHAARAAASRSTVGWSGANGKPPSQQKRQAVSVVADKVLFLDGPGERIGELDQAGRTASQSDGVRRRERAADRPASSSALARVPRMTTSSSERPRCVAASATVGASDGVPPLGRLALERQRRPATSRHVAAACRPRKLARRSI